MGDGGILILHGSKTIAPSSGADCYRCCGLGALDVGGKTQEGWGGGGGRRAKIGQAHDRRANYHRSNVDITYGFVARDPRQGSEQLWKCEMGRAQLADARLEFRSVSLAQRNVCELLAAMIVG